MDLAGLGRPDIHRRTTTGEARLGRRRDRPRRAQQVSGGTTPAERLREERRPRWESTGAEDGGGGGGSGSGEEGSHGANGPHTGGICSADRMPAWGEYFFEFF